MPFRTRAVTGSTVGPPPVRDARCFRDCAIAVTAPPRGAGAAPGRGHGRLDVRRKPANRAAGPARETRWRRLREYDWIAVLLLAVCAFVFGVWGAEGDLSWSGIAHRLMTSLHNFSAGFDTWEPEEHWQSFVAKLLAPIALLYATLRILFALYAERIEVLWARRQRRHAVIVGMGETGVRLARAFRGAGSRIVAVDVGEDGLQRARELGLRAVRGDARELPVLRRAAVEHARYLVCCTGSDVTNARVASAILPLREGFGNRPLTTFIHLDVADVAAATRVPTADPVRIEFFNVHDAWAQALLEQPLASVETAPGDATADLQLAVLGLGPLGRAVLVHAARTRYFDRREEPGRAPIAVTAVGRDAGAMLAPLAALRAAIDEACRLTVRDVPAPASPFQVVSALLDDPPGPVPGAIVVCLESDEANLATAIELERRLGDALPPVYLPRPVPDSGLAALFARAPGGLGVRGRIRPVAIPEPADPARLGASTTLELLARAIHAGYVRDRLRSGRREQGLPFVRPWDELPEEARASSEAQARAIGVQLQAVWHVPAPLGSWADAPLELDPTAVEVMAQWEHDRWRVERTKSGYRYGDRRSESERTHPDLIEWEQLPESQRQIDRQLMRRRPFLLGRVGYRIDADPRRERVAAALHEVYRAGTRQARERTEPWEALSDEAREGSRRHVAHLPVLLRAVRCRIAEATGADRPAFRFRGDELERLAELEHQRWVHDHRRVSGGAHDPDDLPWSQLPANRRDVDRRLLSALPGVLAEVGLTIVRANEDPHQIGA